MSSRGVSASEKRRRMLQVFHDTKEVFQLKELEKIGPKKGVIAQSVKDVIQNLVDDNEVTTDKIGTSVYFWAFLSDVVSTRKRKLDNSEVRCGQLNVRMEDLTKEIANAKKARLETSEREEILSELEKLKTEKVNLEKEINHLPDPDIALKLDADIAEASNALERWTDNWHALKVWVKRKFVMDLPDLDGIDGGDDGGDAGGDDGGDGGGGGDDGGDGGDDGGGDGISVRSDVISQDAN